MEILLFRRAPSPEQHSHILLQGSDILHFSKQFLQIYRSAFSYMFSEFFVSLKNFNRNPLKDLTENKIFHIFII